MDNKPKIELLPEDYDEKNDPELKKDNVSENNTNNNENNTEIPKTIENNEEEDGKQSSILW